MPTKPKPEPRLTAEGTEVVGSPLGLRDIAILLVKHYGFHEGLYDPVIQFAFGVTGMEIPDQGRVPTGLVGVSNIGLSRAPALGSNTVDAALVNPIHKTVVLKKKPAPTKVLVKAPIKKKVVVKKAPSSN